MLIDDFSINHLLPGILLWYTLGVMVGWLRNWGIGFLLGSIAVFGVSWQVDSAIRVYLWVVSGVLFSGAMIKYVYDFRLAKKKDREEKLRKSEAGIRPWVSPSPTKSKKEK